MNPECNDLFKQKQLICYSEGLKYKPLAVCFKKSRSLIIGQEESDVGKDGIGAKGNKSPYFHTGATVLTYRKPTRREIEENGD